LQKKTPSALIARTRRHSSSEISRLGRESPGTPAEQTRTSMGPSSLSTRRSAVSTSRERETSPDVEDPVLRVGLEIERGDLRALRDEPRDDGGADAARPARDERDSPGKSIIVAHVLGAKPKV
jgi:hypothetical protein